MLIKYHKAKKRILGEIVTSNSASHKRLAWKFWKQCIFTEGWNKERNKQGGDSQLYLCGEILEHFFYTSQNGRPEWCLCGFGMNVWEESGLKPGNVSQINPSSLSCLCQGCFTTTTERKLNSGTNLACSFYTAEQEWQGVVKVQFPVFKFSYLSLSGEKKVFSKCLHSSLSSSLDSQPPSIPPSFIFSHNYFIYEYLMTVCKKSTFKSSFQNVPLSLIILMG